MAFPNQIQAARNIIEVGWEQKKLRYAILKARCQSGKTGAYQVLIRFMLTQGMISHAYILCGSDDVELREQAKADTKQYNSKYYNEDNTGVIKVFFRQDFKHATLNIVNALIVVDESHLDQTQGQQLDTFLQRHGLGMDGNPAPLNANNSYIVSVDATPYSELAVLAYKEMSGWYDKHVEDLVPGDGYYGLADYKGESKLRPTFDISHNSHQFSSMLMSHPAKYILIRMTNGKANTMAEGEIKKICHRDGHDFLLYTSKPVGRTEIAMSRREQLQYSGIPCLEDAPSKTTVVMIRGRLRAGKVVPKQHVAAVWEGARDSKTDSLVQGLPGRMCGYRSAGAGKAIVYVPPSALTDYEKKVVKASEIDRAILEYPFVLPMKGTNLKKAHVATRPANGTTQCSPLRLELNASDDCLKTITSKYLDEYKAGDVYDHVKAECRKKLMANLHLITENPNYSDDQKREIIEKLKRPDNSTIHLRNYHGSSIKSPNGTAISQKNYYKEVLSAYQTSTVPSENIEGCDFLNFLVAYNGFTVPHVNKNHIYVIFYTKAGPELGLGSVNIKSRIPTTNGKSIFSQHDRHMDVAPMATCRDGFTDAALSTPEALERTIRERIERWKSSTPDLDGKIISRCIQGEKDQFNLSRAKFHHESAKVNDVKLICRRLSAEFGIKMKVLCAQGRHASDSFNVKSISW
jgi:hypothetical protein